MGESSSIQQLLFQQIKQNLPANLSMVHEISELLGLSYDSAYRRIRGEKELSLDELAKLCTRFSISLDALMGMRANHVVFLNHQLDPEKFHIKQWLTVIREDIKRIHQAHEKEIIYAAKDPPIFHYFHFPEIAAFKFFFWEKTIFHFPELEGKRLRLDDIDPEIIELGNGILRSAVKIPTIEIWNEDTFRIFLRQIEYYWISGYFSRKDDVFNLIDKLDKWLRHIRKEAEYGFKFLLDDTAEGIENSFMLYENEVVLNDNSIHVKLDNASIVYLTYNVICLLITREPSFCQSVERHMRSLIKKSNLISLTGSKERNRFFNKLLYNIEQFRSRLETD
jgi:hypothetical protein